MIWIDDSRVLIYLNYAAIIPFIPCIKPYSVITFFFIFERVNKNFNNDHKEQV